MPAPDEAPLVAVLLPRRDAVAAVAACWDAGEAVAVVDPAAPGAQRARTLAAVAPTHLLDHDGRRAVAGGRPVGGGVAAVVVTSGTTGEPKAVELTRDGLATMGHGVSRAIGAGPGDRWLLCMPAHHVGGLAIVGRAHVTGAGIVAHPGFDVAAVAAAPDEGATLLSVVPTMLRRLLDSGAPLDRWRRVLVGGAPTPATVRARALDAGAALVDAYGQSETWGGCVLDGVPIDGVDVRLGSGDEVQVRGPVVMRGYRGRPDATREAFTGDGWLRTGDVGAWADGGRLRVVERTRDVVITGGVNVSPTAVEDVLATHPAVADVGVAGVPDDEWGERVVAWVVPVAGARAPTLDELRDHARASLSAPQLPREVVVVDALPRTGSGKLQRRRLREERSTGTA